MKTAMQVKREAKQLFRLCLKEGVMDESLVRQVVKRLCEATQRDRMALLAHFRRLVRLDRVRHTARVESAAPLPPGLQAGVQADLDRRYGPGLQTSFDHSPRLIGGMRVKVGDDVYDGSVQARLAALDKTFGISS